MTGPGGLDGIYIKTRPFPQVVTLRLISHQITPGTGIRHDQGDTQFRRVTLGPGLCPHIIVGAGEPGQPVNSRHRLILGSRRQVSRKSHFTVTAAGFMLVTIQPTAKLLDTLYLLHGLPTQKITTDRMLSPACIKSNALLISSRGIL